jgi:RES domain-containing protein
MLRTNPSVRSREVSVASWLHDPIARSGIWIVYRQAPGSFPPLWHRGSQRQPTDQPEGRWHSAGAGHIVQYASLDSDGAWAELVRYEGIRTEAQRQAAEIRVQLWQLTVEETDIADLSTFDRIAACGLDPAEIVAEQHPYCQALADDLREAGYRGVLAPSAAMSDVVNLSLFGPRREVLARELTLRGEPNPNPGYFIPVKPLADDTVPPADILNYTRHHGDPHLGLELWQVKNKPQS